MAGADPLLLPVPDTRQATPYTCSAAALQAVLAYYGLEAREDELSRLLHCTPEQGAPPEAIVEVCGHYGLRAELHQGTTWSELEAELRAGRPVIVDAQAWREGNEAALPWKDVWEAGHYMVAIGLDSRHLYLEDPSLLGSRGVIERSEFDQRWHDYETASDGRRILYSRSAIFVRGRTPRPPGPLAPVP